MKRTIDAGVMYSVLSAIETREVELTMMARRLNHIGDFDGAKAVYTHRDVLSCILFDIATTVKSAKDPAPGAAAASYCLSLEVVASPSTTPAPSPSSSSS